MSLKGSIPLLPFILCNQDTQAVPVREAGCPLSSLSPRPQNSQSFPLEMLRERCIRSLQVAREPQARRWEEQSAVLPGLGGSPAWQAASSAGACAGSGAEEYLASQAYTALMA